jgi:predicted nucleic acid-binding protein
MKYVDSNVFIYSVVAEEKSERKASLSKKILLKVADGSLAAATSVLTWDELVWATRKFSGLENAIKEGKFFLEFPNLKILKVDSEVIKEAQKLVETYKLKPRDAIHAACAIKNNIKEIISDYPDFDKVKEIKRIKLESV